MQRPATALTERFGPGVKYAGPLLNTAAATHLVASSSATSAHWSAGEPCTIRRVRGQQQSSMGVKPASAFAWSADDLPLYELGERGEKLRAKATGSGGRTVECFSPAAQLSTLMTRCKEGEASFNEAAFAALERLARTKPNWFQVGFDQGGTLGAICFTCDDDDRQAKALGSTAASGPFNNLVKHCEKAKNHEQAREKLRAEIDEMHHGLLERGEETVTRCACSARCTPQTAPPYPFEPRLSPACNREMIAALLFQERLSGPKTTPPAPPPATRCAPCEPDPNLQPAGSEQLGPQTRGSTLESLPPVLPPSKQQQLDSAVGLGKYVVDPDEATAACQRCSRFKRMTINLRNNGWLANATTHEATHLSGIGMNTLDTFGFGVCTTRLCDAVSPAVELPYGSLCHGFWLPAVTYDDQTLDTSLLNQDWRPGDKWSVDTTFRATVTCSREGDTKLLFPVGSVVDWLEGGTAMSGKVLGIEGAHTLSVLPDAETTAFLQMVSALLSPISDDATAPTSLVVRDSSVTAVTYSILRPYRHRDCASFCVDPQTGAKRPNLMCRFCASVPELQEFKDRLRRRASADLQRMQDWRFDRLPTVSDVIEAARRARAAKCRWKLQATMARKMIGRSYARVRSMRERLDAQLLTGDLAGLAADLRYCQEHEKFAGKQVTLTLTPPVLRLWLRQCVLRNASLELGPL